MTELFNDRVKNAILFSSFIFFQQVMIGELKPPSNFLKYYIVS